MKVLALSALFLAGLAPAASAAQFNVNIETDPAPGPCEQAPGDCSLREAVIAAQAAGSNDFIDLPAGTYVLSNAGGGVVGDLDAGSPTSGLLTIRNAGAPGSVTIDANGDLTEERALEVHNGGSVTLEDLIIIDGVAPLDGDDIARGGAIKVNTGGGLLMKGGAVTSNHAAPLNDVGQGGGVYNEGVVTITDALLNVNNASVGGGVFTTGTGQTTIQRTTIRANVAAFGGGVAGQNDGTTNVTESRLGRNEAPGGSGGGAFVLEDAEITLYSTNVDNNTAGIRGGGVRALSGRATINNSTVTANSAPEGGGIALQDDVGGSVGGITLRNSIVAANLDSDGIDIRNDCAKGGNAGQIISEGWNLVGYQYNCNITGLVGEDQIGGGTDGTGPPIIPLLTTEAFYGGPNVILMNGLDPQSPAVNTGAPDAKCGQTDLRGVPREKGGPCDSGAYELVRCEGVVVNRVGTPADDTSARPEMEPTTTADGILGLGGSDRVRGGEGNDALCGNGGEDRLKGDEGKDRLSGGPGRDVCIGGPGKDTAKGCEVVRSIP